MKLSKPVLEVVRWACEQRLEDCRLPIEGLWAPSIDRAAQLGLVVVGAPGRPARKLLAATNLGREVYSQRLVDHTPSPEARARKALRRIFRAAQAKQLVGAIFAVRNHKRLASAVADVLCALEHAFEAHGVGAGHELPRVQVWAHPEGIAVFLPEDDDIPGVVLSRAFVQQQRALVGVLPWLIQHHTPATMRRSNVPLPTRWLYYLAEDGGQRVRQVHPSTDQDADEKVLRRYAAAANAVANRPAREWL